MNSAHPHWFGDCSAASGALFGHLHVPPDGRGRGPAVLLCGAFGHEEMSSHRSLRLLAEQLAARGSVCLHFDQVGTGDSADALQFGERMRPPAGVASAQEGLAAWPVAIGQAVDHLKRVSGAQKVVLFGLRLGATMATLASQGRDDIQALIALAPVLRGKAFAREAKVLGQATLARTGMHQVQDSSVFEFGGYALNPDDLAFLNSIDLMRPMGKPAPEVLLLDRDDLPFDPAWADHLRTCGVAVAQVCLPGYAAMMQVPHLSTPPQAILDRVLEWVSALPDGAFPRVESGAASIRDWGQGLSDTLRMSHLGVNERAFWLRGASPLSVIVSTPAVPVTTPQPAVLMINTGGERRIGSNRMYTRWSRSWASRGWTTMRMDLAGLGHSPARPGHAHEIHLRHAHEDIRAAVAHLREAHGATQVHLIGLCSGAFHALHSVFEGQAVDSVTSINQMVYFWQENMPLQGEHSEAVTVVITQNMKQSLLDPNRWLKLIKGQVHVTLILRALLRRMLQRAQHGARYMVRIWGMPLAHDLHTELIRISRRGVHVHLVFSEGEAGLTMVQEHASRALVQLKASGDLQLSVIQNADHTFTRSEAQQRLLQVVDNSLQSRAMRAKAAKRAQQDMSALCPTP